jgi:hypothetical protein
MGRPVSSAEGYVRLSLGSLFKYIYITTLELGMMMTMMMPGEPLPFNDDAQAHRHRPPSWLE